MVGELADGLVQGELNDDVRVDAPKLSEELRAELLELWLVDRLNIISRLLRHVVSPRYQTDARG